MTVRRRLREEGSSQALGDMTVTKLPPPREFLLNRLGMAALPCGNVHQSS